MNGSPVTNIFAYGPDGRPLQGVQLFDQSGKPLDPFGLEQGDGRPCANDDCTSLVESVQPETGQSVLNVAEWDDQQGASVPVPGATPTQPGGPFLKVPAVQPQKVAKSNH